MLLDNAIHTLRQTCQLDETRLLVIGVSGGPDSLCLLDLLHRLSYRLHVVYVNHQLRPEAAAEVLLVRQAAEQRRLSFASHDVQVQSYAASHHLTIEAAARQLRYEKLFNEAQDLSAQAVVVGHTADDQVETVLLHLLHGSGLAGLRGMQARSLPNAFSTTIPLVRPLLSVWRREIEAYCQARGLKPVEDHSNLDTGYTRNQLRHEILPYLDHYQPGLRQRLLNMAGLLAEEDDLLNSLADSAWQICLQRESIDHVAFDLTAFRRQPLSIQRRLLRRAAVRLRPSLTEIGYDAIQRAISFVDQPTKSGQSDWLGKLRLEVEGDYLWLVWSEASLPRAEWPQMPCSQPLTVNLPGSLDLADDWKLQAELVNPDGEEMTSIQANKDPYQTWLDVDRLSLPMTLRGRRTGDVFQPLGMNGQVVKLKDWMIKHKMPKRLRANWPLLCSADAIIWVPGYQTAHDVGSSEETNQLVHLKLT